IPPFALTVFVLNLVIISKVKNNVNCKRIIFIAAGSFAGLPFGVFALKYVNQDVIRFSISLITFVLGLLFLFGLKPKIKESKTTFIISGIVSGILSGAAAMGGPPLIFILMSMGFPKDNFRATLLGCFLFNGIYANTLYFVNGLFSLSNLRISLLGLVPALAGTILGIKTKNMLTEEQFNRATLIIVIIIGIIGIIRALCLLKTCF
ncbi:MAG TPA: sulfite exporter TauE/SafE family protein, partial [bacterium]|nr:sulfite exporter TauE/SafE family protein [bacterium]